MDFKLNNKVVIVTGATANIGRAIALDLATEGVILIAAGRDQQAGQKLVEQAKTLGATDAIFISADLTQTEAAKDIVQTAKQYGPIYALINGVGGNIDQGFFVDSNPEKWSSEIDLNFGTLLRVTHTVLPEMIQQKSGSIINIGSTAGLVGDYTLPVYSAMKGAVHSFTKVLAKEVGQHGVRVNAIAPYATFSKDQSSYSKGSRFHPDNIHFFKDFSESLSEFDQAMRMRKPVVGRPFATPEEISALAVYLASDKSSFVTGQVWAVDGGSLL